VGPSDAAPRRLPHRDRSRPARRRRLRPSAWRIRQEDAGPGLPERGHLWHFHFHGPTPLAPVKGRERTYFEHFWNDFAADKRRSIPEKDRRLYAAAYARANGIRAGFEYFRSFEQDARDFAAFSSRRLDMPVLVLTGEKASGTFLIDQARMVATDVTGTVVKNAGHWLMEEAPDQVVPAIVAFLD
jgi:pimeloyl-ACP methyl ester carboxylesterase